MRARTGQEDGRRGREHAASSVHTPSMSQPKGRREGEHLLLRGILCSPLYATDRRQRFALARLAQRPGTSGRLDDSRDASAADDDLVSGSVLPDLFGQDVLLHDTLL